MVLINNKRRTKVNNRPYINTMVFEDDKVIIQNNESEFHGWVVQFHKSVRIATWKYLQHETMGFMGKYPLQTKITLDNTSTE